MKNVLAGFLVAAALCAKNGWMTIKDMRQASYLQLKSDMEKGVF